ncbi:aminotransferase class I/II-fold pyridoxal phosphate-dependent enzyme [Burkholderia sp. TSV86]|uniref:aminotransferase class I/II-fold pyridoxal phosphate-dependent enzyme n=1 Tax=Burkholderia sp. TSV86 TaxID=1385594 RepID=UPI00075D403D|nr:aminotransferase class I/II-fold pyridoxal phosphate-dependent enzyme [Burkholderia sp. TSV86]KVE37917.1 hypothetical protein WS68_25385 [Burkholderia sp. TSV86]
MLPPLNRIVASLDNRSPFLGAKALERLRGRPYRARLGANESLFGVCDAVKQAWEKSLAESSYYNDPTHYDLRTTIAESWQIGIDRISVAEGIDSLLELLFRAYIEPGDCVVTSLGAYPTFDYHAAGFGARLIQQPYLPNYVNDLDGIQALAWRHRPKLIYLANPDNPTGSFFDANALLSWIDHMPGDCLVVLDEAYAEFAPIETLLPRALERPNLVRLRTFSKAYGLAGARVGYLIGRPELVQALDSIRLHFGVAKASQEAALAAYRDTVFVDHVVSETIQANRHYYEIAAQIGVPTLSSTANFVAFDFGTPENALYFANWLENHDIFVRRPPVGHLNQLIRVTAAPLETRRYFQDVILDGMRNRPAACALRESS